MWYGVHWEILWQSKVKCYFIWYDLSFIFLYMNYSFGIFWSKLKGLLWVTDQVPSFPYICWVKVFIYLFICFLFICQKKIYSHTDTQYINGTPRMHELRACGAPYLSKSTHPRKFGNHVIVHRVTIHPHHRHTSVNIGVRGIFCQGGR